MITKNDRSKGEARAKLESAVLLTLRKSIKRAIQNLSDEEIASLLVSSTTGAIDLAELLTSSVRGNGKAQSTQNPTSTN